MTIEEFIRSEMIVWGEDYIYDLIDRGYEPILTNKGWKWITPVRECDNAGYHCYST